MGEVWIGEKMSTYLIHSCEKRYWYVRDYLVPSMIKQGIREEDIIVDNDDNKQGCLVSYIKSFDKIGTTLDGTWHLQDDVLISSDFKAVTEKYDSGVVCGFCSFYSNDVPAGIRPVQDMWYSFPCIRIPNVIFKGFIDWVTSKKIQKEYQVYIRDNKFVDFLFRKYVLSTYKDRIVRNLAPNIVENVDFLLGGSVINYIREDQPCSLYFNEQNLVEELKCSIENSVYKQK